MPRRAEGMLRIDIGRTRLPTMRDEDAVRGAAFHWFSSPAASLVLVAES
jgi:hypothetical protein